MADTIPFQRPQRWDASFDPEMSEAEAGRLMALAPFKDMDPASFPKRISLRDIIRHDTRVRRVPSGGIVVRQGDYGTSAFLIVSGEVRVVLSPDLPASMLGRPFWSRKNFFRLIAQVWSGAKEPETRRASELKQEVRVRARQDRKEANVILQDVPRILNEHRTVVLQPGEIFGEIAALCRQPRTATVFADEGGDAELLEIRWQGLRDLMRYNSTLRAHIDKIYRERALGAHLLEMPMFQHLNEVQLKAVMDQTTFGTYGDYDWSGDYKRMVKDGLVGQLDREPVIAEEGHYPNGVILIRAGFARLSQKFGHGHRTLNYLGCGQSYGFREVAHNWRNKSAAVPLQYTLRIIGYTHIISIPTAVMEEIVLPTIPADELPAPIAVEKSAPGGQPAKARAEEVDAGAKIGSEMMEFLTENRFFNGTATMFIDLDRCTRCDDCVRACATAHENNPRFLRSGPTHGKIMVANACMHCADPVCMIECPTGAIHRHSFGGEVIINQTTCIGCKSCASNCPYEAIRMVNVRDQDGVIVLDHEMKPIIKATKCDLCVEQIGGAACQRACPHGALQRVNMNDLDGFARWLSR